MFSENFGLCCSVCVVRFSVKILDCLVSLLCRNAATSSPGPSPLCSNSKWRVGRRRPRTRLPKYSTNPGVFCHVTHVSFKQRIQITRKQTRLHTAGNNLWTLHDSWSILVDLSRGFFARSAILKAEKALGMRLENLFQNPDMFPCFVLRVS